MYLKSWSGSERRLVQRAAALAGPGVVLLAAALRAAALRRGPRVVLLTAAGTAAGVTRTGPHGLADLRGGVAQARPDLVHVDLEHRALVALTILVRTRIQPALHDHP